VCTCNEGYSFNSSTNICEPICSETCVMGTCIAPESCSCFMYYGLLENSKYICEPICEKACLNGRCTAPGVCTCQTRQSSTFANLTAKLLANRSACAPRQESAPALRDIAWLTSKPRKSLVLNLQDYIRCSQSET